MIEQALRILGAAGVPLDYRDMADALWLAALLPHTPAAPEESAADRQASTTTAVTERASTSHLAAAQPTERRRVRISSGTVLRDEHDLYATPPRPRVSGTGVRVSRVRVPGAPGLHDALAIARALRPLARRYPSRHAEVLDEEATAERSAEAGVLTPVFAPARERWFEVALVVEDVPSMALWRRVIADLHRLLQHQGAFRDVRRWTLSLAGGKAHVIDPAGAARQTRELRDPEARRLILVVSDCVSPAWYGRTMATLLADWGVTTPVAVLQLLPDHLWAHTALGSSRARFGASAPGIPNAGLFVERAWWDDDPITGQLPLPVLTLDARAIGDWSRMLMGMGARARGVIIDRHLMPANAVQDVIPDAAVPPPDAEGRVMRFRSMVSLDAYRLASYLAVVPLTLPVIRLVHAAMFARPSESQLAEVLLGGIIERVTPADAKASDDEVEYEFAATPEERAENRGAALRGVLLRSIRRSEAHRVLAAVSRYVADRVGTTVDFGAWVRTADGTETLPEAARPFARLAASTMRRLGSAVTEASVVRAVAGSATVGTPVEVEEDAFAEGLTVMRRVELKTAAEQLAWSPDGSMFAVRHARAISVVETGNGADTVHISGTDAITAMVWAQSSRELAYTTLSSSGDTSTLHFNTIAVGGESHPASTLAPTFFTAGPVVDLDWRAPADELALALPDGRVRFWRRNTDTALGAYAELADRSGTSVRALSWSTNGVSLAVLYDDGEVEIATGIARMTVKAEPIGSLDTASMGALAWEPQDRWLAVARHEGSVSIMSRSRQPMVELSVGDEEVLSVSVSRDSSLLVAVCEETMLIWRSIDWMVVGRISLEDLRMSGVVAAFSPSANVLALATTDGVQLLRVDALQLTTKIAESASAPLDEDDDDEPRTLGMKCAVVITTAGLEREPYLQGGGAAAQRFLDWFHEGVLDVTRYSILLGEPSPELHRAPSGAPTLAAFRSALESAADQSRRLTPPRERSRLYIYFSGLGGRLPATGERIVYVRGESPGERVPVPVKQYVAALADAQLFDEIVFIGDCDDDTATDRFEIVPWSPSLPHLVIRKRTRTSSQVVMHSGKYPLNPKSWAFTEALLTGLNGAAANERGKVTVLGLRSFLPRERDRLIGDLARDRRASAPVEVSLLTGDDFVLANADRPTGRIQIWSDNIFKGRTLRVRNSDDMEVISYTAYEIGGEGPDFYRLPVGNYIADVVGLPVQKPFHLSSTDDPERFEVRLEWAPTQLRVLIAGSGGDEISPVEMIACEQLGRALAQSGHRLVTGGWPGVDHVVAREYVKWIARQHVKIDDYLTHVLEDRESSDFTAGLAIRLAKGAKAIDEALDHSDALVAVGGKGGTMRIVRRALDRGHVVLPWGATGGDAQKAIRERVTQRALGDDWQWLMQPITDPEHAAPVADRIAATITQLLKSRGGPAGDESPAETPAPAEVEEALEHRLDDNLNLPA